MFNVLVLCTANSARSILGESILNARGGNRFRAFSAGSHPRGSVNPLAIEILKIHGHATGGLRSKSWDEFSAGPRMDLVVTVCDAAAGESCPYWPGSPFKAHWGIPDPAGVSGGIEAERAAFATAYERLDARMSALVALPVESMDQAALQIELTRIGSMDGATERARDGDQ